MGDGARRDVFAAFPERGDFGGKQKCAGSLYALVDGFIFYFRCVDVAVAWQGVRGSGALVEGVGPSGLAEEVWRSVALRPPLPKVVAHSGRGNLVWASELGRKWLPVVRKGDSAGRGNERGVGVWDIIG